MSGHVLRGMEMMPNLDRRTVLKHGQALAHTTGLPATTALAQAPKKRSVMKPQHHMGGIVAAFLLAGTSAAPALALEFPIHANDLNPGERIFTVVHGTSDPAQTGAKDLH